MPPTRAARWMTRSGRASANSRGRRRPAAQVVVGADAGVTSRADAALAERAHDGPAEEAAAAGDEHRCGRTRTAWRSWLRQPTGARPAPSARRAASACGCPTRSSATACAVATIDRPCVWPSPSSSAGTACPAARRRSALEPGRARWQRPADVELVGVAARHREPPPAPWRPPVPVRHLPLPRRRSVRDLAPPALARGRAGDRRRSTSSTPPAYADPAALRARWSSPSTTSPSRHDPRTFTRHGLRFFDAASSCARRRRPTSCCARRRRRSTTARPPAFDRDRLRLVPWGVDRRAWPTPTRSTRVRAALRARPAATCCRSAPSSPARTCRACSTPSPRLDRRRRRPGARRPAGWNEDARRALGGPLGDRVRLLGFVPRAELARPLRRRRGVLLSEPAGGVRPAGARGHGAGHAGGHLGRHGDAEVGGDAALARRSHATPTPSPTPSRRSSTTTALAERARRRGPARARPRSRGSARRRSTVAVYRGGRPRTLREQHVGTSASTCCGSSRRGRRQRGVHRVGLLRGRRRRTAAATDLDLVAVTSSTPFADAYPDLVDAFPTGRAPLTGPPQAAAGRGREHVAAPRQARRDRRRPRAPHGRRPCRRCRQRPACVTIHDLQPLDLPGQLHAASSGPTCSGRFRRSVREAAAGRDADASSSRRDVRRALRRRSRAACVVGTPWGVEPSGTQLARRARSQARYGLAAPLVLLYPAITYPHKNHVMLLRAFAGVAAHEPDVDARAHRRRRPSGGRRGRRDPATRAAATACAAPAGSRGATSTRARTAAPWR